MRRMKSLVAVSLALFSDLARFFGVALRPRTSLVAENLFLRKQLAYYREHQVRPRPLSDAARLSLVFLSRLFDWRNALMIVKPETLVGWHLKGFKLFWRWKSRPGRPCGAQKLIQTAQSSENARFTSRYVACRSPKLDSEWRSADCRRFCSYQSTRVQQKSTSFNGEGVTGSTAITWKQQNSTDFNKAWNLVRDQGVGGSNPLSPTNLFNYLQQRWELQNRPTWFCTRFSSVRTRINTEVLRRDKCGTVYKIVYRSVTEKPDCSSSQFRTALKSTTSGSASAITVCHV
jgi:hypothetical protein